MDDYTKNLKRASEFPKYYLGQEIDTPEGKGIIVCLSMPTNGLYISPERSSIIVWYGVDPEKTHWVQKSYLASELDEFNKGKLHG